MDEQGGMLLEKNFNYGIVFRYNTDCEDLYLIKLKEALRPKGQSKTTSMWSIFVQMQ